VNSSGRRVATHCPLSGSAAGQQRAEITDGRSYKLEPEVHANDKHCSVDGGEEVAEHSSVDNSSDWALSVDECEQVAELSLVDNTSDRVRNVDECEQVAEHSSVHNSSDGAHSVDKCEQVTEHSSVDNSSDGARSVDECEQVTEHSSVDNSSDGACSIYECEQVAEHSSDICDHTFCAACLQELSQNENNCPVNKNMFNFIPVRHQFDGEIIMRIHVQPVKRKGECTHEDNEPLCCQDTLDNGWILVFALTYILAFWYAVSVLTAHFTH
jgi:hypothetical protein